MKPQDIGRMAFRSAHIFQHLFFASIQYDFIFSPMQYAAMRLIPTWVRTIIGGKMNEAFREEYFAQQKIK